MSKNKKIIAYYSNTAVLGGSEVYLKVLLDHINPDDYDVFFFCSPDHPLKEWAEDKGTIKTISLYEKRGGGPMDKSEKKDTPTIQAPCHTFKDRLKNIMPSSFKLFLGTLKEMNRLRKLFAQYPLDIIHFNDTGCEPPVIAARLAGIAHVMGTYHVVPSQDKERGDWVHRLIEYWSTRSLHQAISVSNATKQAWMARSTLKGNNIQVIYNGVDHLHKSFCDAPNTDDYFKEFNLNPDHLIIVVPARLHIMKGHRYLIEAMPKIVQQHPTVQFLFTGDGPLQEELIALARQHNVEPHIHFLGFRKDIVPIMKIAHLVVLPSIALEALPFALIEAHACSKAIVASNFSGIPEIVEEGKTGLLVPCKDTERLSTAINSLLADPKKRQRMGMAGRQRVEELFTLDMMLEKTFKLYQQNDKH